MIAPRPLPLTPIRCTRSGADMFFELLAELRDVGLHRPRCRVGEHTDRLAFHVAGNRQQIIQVLKPSLALGNTIEDAVHPACSFAAGRTLTARLVSEEL